MIGEHQEHHSAQTPDLTDGAVSAVGPDTPDGAPWIPKGVVTQPRPGRDRDSGNGDAGETVIKTGVEEGHVDDSAAAVQALDAEKAALVTDADAAAAEMARKLDATAVDLAAEAAELRGLQRELDDLGEHHEAQLTEDNDASGFPALRSPFDMVPTDEQDHPAELQKRSGSQILTAMQSAEGSWDHPVRLFTDAQLAAAEDPAAAADLVKSGLQREPFAIFKILDSVGDVLPPEEVRAALDAVSRENAGRILSEFRIIQQFYPPEDRKTFISTLLDPEKDPHAALDAVPNVDIAPLFEPDELRDIVVRAAHAKPMALLSSYGKGVQTFIDSGYLTEDDVRTAVLQALKPTTVNGYTSSGTAELKYASYFTGEHRETLRSALKEAYLDPDHPLRLYDFATPTTIYGPPVETQGEGVLTEDEKREIVQTRIQRNPGSMLETFDALKQYASPEDVAACIRAGIDQRASTLFSSYGPQTEILQGDYISPAEKEQFIDILFNEHGYSAFDNLALYLEGKSTEEQKALVKKLVAANPSIALGRTEQWLTYISNDPEEQKTYVHDFITHANILEITDPFIATPMVGASADEPSYKDSPFIARDEVKALLFRQLEQGTHMESFPREALINIRTILGTDEEFKSFVERAAVLQPETIVKGFRGVQYLYTEGEAADFIGKVAGSSRNGAKVCLESVSDWGRAVTPEFLSSFFDAHKESQAITILTRFTELTRFLPDAKRTQLAQDLIHINPALVLADVDTFQAFIPDLSTAKIAEMAQADQERYTMLPKTLAEFYKRVTASKDITEKTALLRDASELYKQIAHIRLAGLEPAYRQIQAAEALSVKQEQALLANAACAALIKEKDPEKFTDADALGSTPEEAAQIVFQELGNRLGIQDISDEERQRFFDTMGTSAPFLTYLLQYEDSPGHRTILEGMAKGILSGNHVERKYGAVTQASLDALKDQQLIPHDITLEQYTLWQTDEQTTLHETLAADAQTVAVEVKKLILENSEHLNADVFGNEGMSYAGMLVELQTELRSVGQEYGSINKRLGQLRRDEADMTGVDAQGLLARKAELESIKADLNKNRAILRLVTVRPDEIASGYFLEGDAKKTAKIGKTIDEMKESVDPEGHFVIDRVKQLVTGFHEQNDEKQNLVASDSSDPKVLIEVGANPVASCQHYDGGAYNEALLGYDDPNIKIVTLTSERGSLVARAILRLLPQQSGSSAVHLERIYAASASTGVARAMFTHVAKKAESLGVPFFVSNEAQDENGAMIAADPPQGFTTEDSEAVLVSSASRAPFSYVDSAGGIQQNGEYQLSGLQTVLRAA